MGSLRAWWVFVIKGTVRRRGDQAPPRASVRSRDALSAVTRELFELSALP